jgi:cell division protein FtsN
MHGPRHLSPKFVLVLTALLLLPACSPRKPIPSDPPDARPEASVRGARRHAPPPAAQPAPQAVKTAPAGPVEETVVAEVKDQKDSDAQIKAAVAESNAREAEMRAQLATPELPVVTKTAPAADTKPAEAKPEPKAEAAKPAGTAPIIVKLSDPKPAETVAPAKTEAKPAEAAPASKPEAAAPDAAKPVDEAQQGAPQAAAKVYMVQIASFSTEKNADAALAWLKEKGYAGARVVRAEQGQAVYNRVQAGPFQDLAAAHKALEELKSDWPQAFIPAD